MARIGCGRVDSYAGLPVAASCVSSNGCKYALPALQCIIQLLIAAESPSK